MSIQITTLEQLRKTLKNIEDNNIEPLTRQIESFRDLLKANSVEAEKLVKRQENIERSISEIQIELNVEEMFEQEGETNMEIEQLGQKLADLEKSKETVAEKLMENEEERKKLTTALENNRNTLAALAGDQPLGKDNVKIEIRLENQVLDKEHVKDLVDLLKNESIEVGLHLKSCKLADEGDRKIITDAILGRQINQKLDELTEKFQREPDDPTEKKLYSYELKGIEKDLEVMKEEIKNPGESSIIRNNLKGLDEMLTKALEANTQRGSWKKIKLYNTQVKDLAPPKAIAPSAEGVTPQAESVEEKRKVSLTKTLSIGARRVSGSAEVATRKLSDAAENLSTAATATRKWVSATRRSFGAAKSSSENANPLPESTESEVAQSAPTGAESGPKATTGFFAIFARAGSFFAQAGQFLKTLVSQINPPEDIPPPVEDIPPPRRTDVEADMGSSGGPENRAIKPTNVPSRYPTDAIKNAQENDSGKAQKNDLGQGNSEETSTSPRPGSRH